MTYECSSIIKKYLVPNFILLSTGRLKEPHNVCYRKNMITAKKKNNVTMHISTPYLKQSSKEHGRPFRWTSGIFLLRYLYYFNCSFCWGVHLLMNRLPIRPNGKYNITKQNFRSDTNMCCLTLTTIDIIRCF